MSRTLFPHSERMLIYPGEGTAAVRQKATIDLLLTDAAETLIRSRARRPNWLPGGFPMKLILSLKREALVDHICGDPQLRAHLRDSSRRLLVPELAPELTAQELEAQVRGSHSPHQLIATALIHDDADIAAAAAHWVLHPEQIPVLPATQPSPEPAASPQPRTRRSRPGAGASEVARRDTKGRSDNPPDETQPNATSVAGSDAQAVEPLTPAIVQSSEEIVAERDRLRQRVTRLETNILDLRSKVPSKSERRRNNKQKGKLKRAEAELRALQVELDALRNERDHLVRLSDDLEDQLEATEHARTVALRKSQHLERRLSSTAGRAEYLRRSLDKDITTIEGGLENLAQGPERTRARKRLTALTDLRSALNTCFPVDTEPTATRPRRVAVGQTLDLTVTPLGGGEEIGGSAILVEAGGRRILVDAGMHPDGRGPSEIHKVLNGSRLNGIVITHAHNDHAGYVPALIDRFHNIPVFCSDATAHLLPTMWADSAKVMDRAFTEAAEGTYVAAPLYGAAEVERAEQQIKDQSYHRVFAFGDLRITLFPAGHILGAAGVVIEAGDKRIVISGDISGLDDHYLSVEPTHLPNGLVRNADLLVIETTYCQDTHRPRQRQEEGLVAAVQSVVNRRGRVLIPAFGLGRSQEVVMILTNHLPDVDVLVDGLAKDISTIYEKVAEGSGRHLSILDGRVRPVRNRWREIQSFHSGVVVSTSGMLTGGPSVAWAQSVLPDDRAALLLCGYQDEEAPGRRLERLASRLPGPRRLTLPDSELGTVDVDVRAEVRKYALSAHADQPALIDIIDRIQPRETMLVHGLPDKQAAFHRDLRNRGIVTVPTKQWQPCP